jgi:hypothetical protein
MASMANHVGQKMSNGAWINEPTVADLMEKCETSEDCTF